MEQSTHNITWQSTKEELNVCRAPNGLIDYDRYRRDRLAEIEEYTRIPLVVCASAFLDAQKVRDCQGQVDIELTDLQGFAEVTKDLPDGPLDVLLHSPGGSPEAAESIVQVLRTRFNPIRFIVPITAKSAATMIAMSGNEILMPPSAELGPIDPQFRLSDGAGGIVMVPAQALIDQFRQAQAEISSNPRLAPAWSPVLIRYGVGLFQMSLDAIQLSKDLVHQWLKSYMFSDRPNPDSDAQRVVDYLADHNRFRSHGRRVSLTDIQGVGVCAHDIRTHDPILWQKVENAWYAIQHTFEGTGAFKLFENSRRKCLVRIIQMVAKQVVKQQPPAGMPANI